MSGVRCLGPRCLGRDDLLYGIKLDNDRPQFLVNGDRSFPPNLRSQGFSPDPRFSILDLCASASRRENCVALCKPSFSVPDTWHLTPKTCRSHFAIRNPKCPSLDSQLWS